MLYDNGSVRFPDSDTGSTDPEVRFVVSGAVLTEMGLYVPSCQRVCSSAGVGAPVLAATAAPGSSSESPSPPSYSGAPAVAAAAVLSEV